MTLQELIKEHICRFNDYPQKCECFIKGIQDFIDQEIERKNGMKKDYLWVNFDEGCGADMSDGYNQAVDEDIVHLTSLKELIK